MIQGFLKADFVGSLSHSLGQKQKYSLFPNEDFIAKALNLEKALNQYSEAYCCKWKSIQNTTIRTNNA